MKSDPVEPVASRVADEAAERAGLGRPDLHRAIAGDRGDLGAGRVPGQLAHGLADGGGLEQPCPAAGVPDPHDPVVTAGGDAAAIRAEASDDVLRVLE